MTLVEILAVVIILGLLAAILAIGFSSSFGKAKSELAKTGIGQVVNKLEMYKMERNEWPSMDVGLQTLSEGYASRTDAYFLEPDMLLDPWDRTYLYIVPGPEMRPYEILSYGADGQPGGEGENADISSADLRKNDR